MWIYFVAKWKKHISSQFCCCCFRLFACFGEYVCRKIESILSTMKWEWIRKTKGERIITIRSFESIRGNGCRLTLNAIYNATKIDFFRQSWNWTWSNFLCFRMKKERRKKKHVNYVCASEGCIIEPKRRVIARIAQLNFLVFCFFFFFFNFVWLFFLAISPSICSKFV